LRDLELRLGLSPPRESAIERIECYSRRLVAAKDGSFYSRSHATDPIGTARALLAWRDALVDAGWNGDAIEGAGSRLEALARAERTNEPVPPGTADRVARVAAELRSSAQRAVYERVTLVEDRSLWSARWRSVFDLLEARGTVVDPLSFERGAPAKGDLGALQRRLMGETGPATIAGDGSLLMIRGDTPGELAELTASLLRRHRRGAVVVRYSDPRALETALGRHGLPGQGHASTSAWRSATQLASLAIELAYEPRDPRRVLELLTLPVGPFEGVVGRCLARAVAMQPGVGGAEWARQKANAAKILRERHLPTDAIEALEVWLETRGVDSSSAPRAALRDAMQRVGAFLEHRLLSTVDEQTYGPALLDARAMIGALDRDERDRLSRDEARHLLEGVTGASTRVDLSDERAGRVDHVDHPSALLAPRDTVIAWGFVSDPARRPSSQPWTRAERAALEAAGIVAPELAPVLAIEAAAWRRAVLLARERVIFVVPGTMKGASTSVHPMWNEIVARLGLDEEGVAKLTRPAAQFLAGPDAELVAPLDLPAGRAAWALTPARAEALRGERDTPATALSDLAICPLRFVLAHRASLGARAIGQVPEGAELNGRLGHRLVEELHERGAFELDPDALEARTCAILADLISREASTLLLAGAVFERSQLVAQLVRAMRELQRFLRASGWRIAAVEEPVSAESTLGQIIGRLDLRLARADGLEAVLDLKWGESTYRASIQKGRAVQLAVYVRGLARSGTTPPAGYFSLASGTVLTADRRLGAGRTLAGPSLDATWQRVERTTEAVMRCFAGGTVPVAATAAAQPMLEALGVAESERDRHHAMPKQESCAYCKLPTICGIAWEAMR